MGLQSHQNYNYNLTKTIILSFGGPGICTWLSWVFCFRVSGKATIKCQPVLRYHLKTQLGKDPFPSSLTWLLAEFSSLLTVGQRLPSSVPCYVDLPDITACFIKINERERESANKGEATILFSFLLITVATLCLLEVTRPVHTPGAGFIQGNEH